MSWTWLYIAEGYEKATCRHSVHFEDVGGSRAYAIYGLITLNAQLTNLWLSLNFKSLNFQFVESSKNFIWNFVFSQSNWSSCLSVAIKKTFDLDKNSTLGDFSKSNISRNTCSNLSWERNLSNQRPRLESHNENNLSFLQSLWKLAYMSLTIYNCIWSNLLLWKFEMWTLQIIL